MAELSGGASAGTLIVIAGDPAEASAVRAALAVWDGDPLIVHWAETLAAGVDRLRTGGVSAVLLDLSLLDLSLPDGRGLDGFVALVLVAPEVPVLILSAVPDEGLARQAVARGAHDYLLKTHLNGHTLVRALRGLLERTAVEEALFAEKERAEVTLNSIGDAVLCTDIAGQVTYLNVVAEDMTGWRRTEAIGQPVTAVFHILDGATREVAQNPMALAIHLNKTVGLTANCILVRRDLIETPIEDSAAPIHDRQGRVTGAVIVFHDVSASRQMSQQMAYLAHHDPLTDLPNRLLLNDRLSSAIAVAQRHGRGLAVLFVDLDHFKYMNDSLGHVIGDRLLQSVAARLTASVRSSDKVSRQGGDEFIVLLSEIERADDAAMTATKIVQALAAPHCIAEHELHITVSIGVSVFPEDGLAAETLIERADIAMYHAKQQGRARCVCFTPDMNVRMIERRVLEAGLHAALRQQELVVHYQPTIELNTGAISGVEALVRWKHPERGLLLPSHFVPIAEESGLIVPLGRWVLHEACRQARMWQDASAQAVPVSVNVSAVEFRHSDFLDGIRDVLRETGLEPRHLVMELTESVVMDRGDSTMAILGAVKALGVGLAIDDFGTGYSNLSYLSQFPIDALKVDHSFLHEITKPSDAAPIISAVISMGKRLNLRVVAEGVETREQLTFLQREHCDEGQGHYFSPPLEAAQFVKLLEPSPDPATFGRAETVVDA